jgi:ribosomal protein L7/L12
MERVVLKDWSRGLRKVSLTKLLRSRGELSLGEAKNCTDRLLRGEEVAVEVSSSEEARQLADEASHLGVVVEHPASAPA